MTTLLEATVASVAEKASVMPPDAQDRLALSLQKQLEAALAEAEDSAKWQEAFDGSHDLLESLYDEGLAEFRAGQTKRLG